MSRKLVRFPADKKRPEMNGAASRRLGNYRKDGNGVIELWWKYYVVAANRNRGRDYASTNGNRLISSLRQSGSFPTTFSIRSR